MKKANPPDNKLRRQNTIRVSGRGGARARPARRFDATVGGITARERIDDVQTEDKALTDYLMRAWLDLVNAHSSPVPRCPHCDGLRIRAERPEKKGQLPEFFCHGCKRSFNRLTGTPFARLRDRQKGEAMIPLLSRQMSLLQAGIRLGRTPKAIWSWLLAFRRYLLELDPSGHWEARVRLGVRVAPRARCQRCGFEGGFLSSGFDPQHRRRIRCPQCGRSRLLDVLQDEGQALAGVVMHDAIDTAVRHRRKIYPDMAVPDVARAAHVDEAARQIQPRRLLADIELPVRTLPPGPTDQREDRILSTYLLPRISEALSQQTTADPCPWCASPQTAHHPLKRPSGLPGFKCRGCLGYFMRVTNTPLVSPLMREYARRFVPMLGWRNTAEAAAQALGVPATQIEEWLPSWRQWLLLLDPSGALETRVRLGMPIELPSLIAKRAHKRRKWLARGWLRKTDGCSYLSADGYVVRISEMGSVWQFEVRAVGAVEVIRSGQDFASTEDARLAAFDVITELLRDRA